MTTFKAPTRAATPKMTLAEIVDTLADGQLGVRFTAYDGSSAGPADAPIGLHLTSPRGTTYLATAPADLDLGMARAYVSGDLTLSGVHPGDPYEALVAVSEGLRLHRPPPLALAAIMRSLGWETLRPVPPPPQEHQPRWLRVANGWRHSKSRDAQAISSHYDVSNAFYEYVLGSSMTYTCAYYDSPASSLADAQEAKYRLVFDKLGLKAGDRLLDVGCGWGGMVRFAARRGVHALGATLSAQQASWAQAAIDSAGLGNLAQVRHSDYRDVTDTGFDAVSSIGLTEHIGIARYPAYFSFLRDRLAPGGRLLNHCITRPTNDRREGIGSFIDRYVFPDGELIGSGTIIRDMQDTGLDVRHSENLREHYALTLRDWNANLVRHWDACVAEVGEGTAKLWGMYMAGSRHNFERNGVQLHQVLAVKPDAAGDARVPLRQWW